MKPVEIHMEPPGIQDGDVVCAATLSDPRGERHRLWYAFPEKWADAVTDWADPFLGGTIFGLMMWGQPVHVHGKASPELLRNLEMFMALSAKSWPQDCQPVDITADEEIEQPPPPEPGQAVMCFSGGVDSSFTAWRHHHGLVGRRTLNIKAGLFAHGFSDIRLEESESYEIAKRANEEMLAELGMELIPFKTNFCRLEAISWWYSHGVAAIAAMMMLARRFDRGVIANSIIYSDLGKHVWPTNPLTDQMLSGEHIKVVDDGGETERQEKIDLLATADWPAMRRNLRVCLHGEVRHENCCECAKCIRTIIMFRTAGVPLPPCFKKDLTDKQIRRFVIRKKKSFYFPLKMLHEAQARGMGNESWAKALRSMIRRSRVRGWWRSVRRWFMSLFTR